MTRTVIRIAADFSPTPAGRFADDGPYSGEVFRRDHLLPAIRSSDEVTVVLNDVEGFGSSFLEEAFGGLVRVEGLDGDEVMRKLVFVSDDPALEDEIRDYIKAAAASA